MDASFSHARGVVGIGLVLHATQKPGRNGPLVARFAEAYVGIDPSVMEKFAILRALEIARAAGVRIVTIRSDYNAMRRALKADHRAGLHSDGSSLHATVLRLTGEFTTVRFGYQPRRKNHEAHTLARRAAKSLPPRHRLVSEEDVQDAQHAIDIETGPAVVMTEVNPAAADSFESFTDDEIPF